jgi:hypothetical protein
VTPFVRKVVEILQRHEAKWPGGMDAYHVRKALMSAGFGKHPAAVAMHLTKLAWKKEYVDSYVGNCGSHILTLTAAGRQLNLKEK